MCRSYSPLQHFEEINAYKVTKVSTMTKPGAEWFYSMHIGYFPAQS